MREHDKVFHHLMSIMELLEKPRENKIINFRRPDRIRKNPWPLPSPTNSVQDERRHPRNNDVAIRIPVRRLRNNVVKINTSKLPDKFMKKVRGLGFAGEPTLVIQKKLFLSDVTENHQRLAIPESRVPAGSRELFSKLGRELREGIKSTLIDDQLREWEITFIKWESNAQYVLRSPWNEVVKANGLAKDKEIQVWSFMFNSKLHFILLKM